MTLATNPLRLQARLVDAVIQSFWPCELERLCSRIPNSGVDLLPMFCGPRALQNGPLALFVRT
jgi:hypothetical protein